MTAIDGPGRVIDGPGHFVGRRGNGTFRHLAALFRMELRLLRRNLTAAVMVGVLPFGLAAVWLAGRDVATVGEAAAAARMASLLGVIPVIFVHHHLVTAYATRRQELVLKRLRAGLPSPWTVLAGTASAPVALYLGQVLLIAGYGVAVPGLPVPANPVAVLLAVLLLAGQMAAFSAVMSAATRSSEAAMVTTFPTMAFFLLTPGMMVPPGALPAPLEEAARWLSPVGPFTEVVRGGWLGRDRDGGQLTVLGGLLDTGTGLAVMAAWLAVALVLVRWVFRWEPRHR